MTTLVPPTASPALDRALAGSGGPGAIARFLDTIAADQVRDAVRTCLPPDHPGGSLDLVRAKWKPGRKLTAEYRLVALGLPGRRLSASWLATSASAHAPAPAPQVEAEARRRGVLAPFTRAWVVSPDGRMTVALAPVDGAFPQLVRWHDRRHLLDVLRSTDLTTGSADLAPEDLRVQTVRYRPGQRHVLRIGVVDRGPAWYAKVYRDDTGQRAVVAGARAAAAFALAGGDPGAAHRAAGVYVPADRVALWPEVAGGPLAARIADAGPGPRELVRTAGRSLRLLHGAPAEDLTRRPDAAGLAVETLRTAELLDVLAPAVGRRLRAGVGRALDLLADLPAEAATNTHGDVKCDNLLVDGARVHLIDFDRSGGGDPAADIGNFLADIRWWTAGDGTAAAQLHEAFLDGYGEPGHARLARARAYEVLSQLRMAVRRVPVQDPDWLGRVDRAVEVATATSPRDG